MEDAMDAPMIDRRSLIAAGLAVGLAPGAALAQDRRRDLAFTDGPLAGNALARQFEKPPRDAPWPPTALLSSGGRRPLSYYRGKTILLSLWAETCAPCIVEMPMFARINAKYASNKFEIVPVITGSKRLNTMARAQKFLNDREIRLPTLMDGGRRGDELLTTVAASRAAPKGSLPCNLLVDAQGRLRGRQNGYVLVFPPGSEGRPAQELARLGKSIWEGPDSAAFFETLSRGGLG